MSVKSIGYSAIALKDGTYTSASIGVNSKGQITQLISNTIEPAGEDLQEGYDELVAIVADSVAQEEQTQTALKDIIDNRLPNLVRIQAKLIPIVNGLQAQYDALEAQFETLNIRITPTLAYSATPENIPSFPTGNEGLNNIAPQTIDTFTLPAGKYTWFFNAYTSMLYRAFEQSGQAGSFVSPAVVPNPLDGSLGAEYNGLSSTQFWFNWASQSVKLLDVGRNINISAIACYDTSDISSPNSTQGTGSVIYNAGVFCGSNTFSLTQTTEIQLKLFLFNSNTRNADQASSGGNQSQTINTLEENVVFNMPVLQVGEMLEIWRVANP